MTRGYESQTVADVKHGDGRITLRCGFVSSGNAAFNKVDETRKKRKNLRILQQNLKPLTRWLNLGHNDVPKHTSELLVGEIKPTNINLKTIPDLNRVYVKVYVTLNG